MTLFAKYKQTILYLIFGVLSTIVNILTYAFCTRNLNIEFLISNWIAWIVAVLFAYITNKLWVFESRSFGKKVLVREIATFFGARFISGIIDLAIMFLFVDMLLFPAMIIKFISNIFVVIFNYVASKVVIFK